MFEVPKNPSENKREAYKSILENSEALIKGEDDYIANLANVSALLYQMLEDVNWVGFYIVRDDQLVLGPFQGNPACIRINKGNGVCGTAFQRAETQLIENIHEFSGHIACDANSNSEIVVPICVNNEVAAVLDIDSPLFNRFGVIDKDSLELLCKKIAAGCKWTNI